MLLRPLETASSRGHVSGAALSWAAYRRVDAHYVDLSALAVVQSATQKDSFLIEGNVQMDIS